MDGTSTNPDDFFSSISEYGALTIASRLKRVSEISSKQAFELYAKYGSDFKPTWFPLMLTLRRTDSLDIQTIANKLRLTHSAVSQFIKEISKAGLISVQVDKNDQRQKKISLSGKGNEAMNSLIPCLKLIEESVMSILDKDSGNLFSILDKLEFNLKEKPFTKRCFLNPDIKIVEYNKLHKNAFKELNKAWIERYFALEANDEEFLDDPEKHLIDKGGQIFMIVDHELPIGTIGIVHNSDDQAEIIRMTIEENWRDQGYAQMLFDHALEYIKDKKYKEVVLETNHILEAANYIYKKKGFEKEDGHEFKYNRANIFMKKVL